MATSRNVVIEKSKSCRGAWYWKVLTDDDEIFAEGGGDDSYDWAVNMAAGALTELQQQTCHGDTGDGAASDQPPADPAGQ